MKKALALVATVLALLVAVPFAAAAGGSSSVLNGYNQVAAQNTGVQSGGGSLGATSPTTGSPTTGTLPFTGLDLGLVAGAGIVLLGVGVSLRRLARTKA